MPICLICPIGLIGLIKKLMATAAIKPKTEAVCRLCFGGAVKTEGQWLKAKQRKQNKRNTINSLTKTHKTMKNLTKIFMAVAVSLFAFACVNDTTEDLGIKVGKGGVTEITVSLE